jgi:hypothetical protein
MLQNNRLLKAARRGKAFDVQTGCWHVQPSSRIRPSRAHPSSKHPSRTRPLSRTPSHTHFYPHTSLCTHRSYIPADNLNHWVNWRVSNVDTNMLSSKLSPGYRSHLFIALAFLATAVSIRGVDAGPGCSCDMELDLGYQLFTGIIGDLRSEVTRRQTALDARTCVPCK